MIVHTDLRSGRITLEQPDDFTAFHVAVAGGDVADERLAGALAPHGRLEGDHAWIEVDAVRALAGEAATTEAWQAGFDAMVDYARSKGFLDGSGDAIRAHLEPA